MASFIREIIEQDVVEKNTMNMVEKTQNPVLALQQVSLKFPDMERCVLQDLTLSIYKGDCIILLGGNGCGKSSLMKLMQGTYLPTKGEVKLLQKPLLEWKNKDSAKTLIALTQDLRASLFFEFTVFENCLLWFLRQGGSLFGIRTIQERVFLSEYLMEFHPNLSEKLDVPLRLLSGGEKQALLLGLCLLHPPQLLLLDEHTSALDPHQTEIIMDLTMRCIQKYHVTTVICTHNLDHALKYGNRLIAIQNGKIIFEADNQSKQKLKREDLLGLCY